MIYRKRPVVIEAFKYDKYSNHYVPQWGVEAYKNGTLFYGCGVGGDELFIKTPEGVYPVSVGDYIVRGVSGELYPCKSDIFEQAYEEVE